MRRPSLNSRINDCEDLQTFRFFSSQLVINGNATQSQIAQAFGVPLVTVKRYVKLYRKHWGHISIFDNCPWRLATIRESFTFFLRRFPKRLTAVPAAVRVVR